MNEDEPTEVILRQGQVHDFLNKDELKSKIPILKKGYGLLQVTFSKKKQNKRYLITIDCSKSYRSVLFTL